jgi:hypothetical protein
MMPRVSNRMSIHSVGGFTRPRKMTEVSFATRAIESIRAGTKRSMRRRVRHPRWWEGHRITYKAYPDGPGTYGRVAELLCARDGGLQRRNPFGEPGDLLRPRGTRLTLEIQRVELSGDLDDGTARCWIVEFSRFRLPRKSR